jgi:glutamyl-Q tRNA(Asp) synthetase
MPAPYCGRYAPTPSGPLHFGSIVAAVASYADARANGGTWLVRIDDIDTPRVVPGAADDILRTLEALGMRWDRNPVYQSRRKAAYHATLHALREDDHVYPCRCSRREIADSAVRGIEGHIYPGTCRGGCAARARAWRYDTRGDAIAFDDAIQGRVTQDVEREIGDFVVYRADGVYAYHLAAAVDDAEQGVTHVVRGADLLVSTPRQIVLQRALGFPTPSYAHVPVAVNAQGEKLSKQTRAAPVLRERAAHALAAALVYLGQPLPDGVDIDVASLWKWTLAHWRLDRVPRVRSIFIDPR